MNDRHDRMKIVIHYLSNTLESKAEFLNIFVRLQGGGFL